jgi:hypothetical protein
MVTLLSLCDYILQTNFVNRILVFLSEQMNARHDVAVVEQRLWLSRLFGLRSFFPRTKNNPVRQSAMDPARGGTYLVPSFAL